MDTAHNPGFITRKQASERCERAERTLQRYWSRAIESQDDTVLKSLKLRTEDGEVIEGKNVTKEKIDDLKKQGRNPTWYVHATWVERKYGPRLEEKPKPPPASQKEAGEGESHSQTPPASSDSITPILREQIQKLEQDKQDLRDEMRIKNKQIEQANERDKETHILMRDLHELLRDMQQRLPAPSVPALADAPSNIIVPEDAHIVATDARPGKTSTVTRPTTKKNKRSNGKKKSRSQESKKVPVGILHRDVMDLFSFRKK